MVGKVPKAEKTRRADMLRILSQKKRMAFYQNHLGETRTVLFEGENKDGLMYGFTDNYIKVGVPFDPDLVNQLVEVQLDSIGNDGVVSVRILELT